MTATTVTPELRKHFVFLFDLGIEYFNTCIAGDPCEAARSLEYDASVYHALHAKLAEVVHSDVELTTDAFTLEGRDLLGRELLGELIEMGATDFDYMLEAEPDKIRERYAKFFAEDPDANLELAEIHTVLVGEANAISFRH